MSTFEDQLSTIRATVNSYQGAKKLGWAAYTSYSAALLDRIAAKKWAESCPQSTYSQDQITEYISIRSSADALANECPPKFQRQADQNMMMEHRIEEVV